jgi:Transcription factor DP
MDSLSQRKSTAKRRLFGDATNTSANNAPTLPPVPTLAKHPKQSKQPQTKSQLSAKGTPQILRHATSPSAAALRRLAITVSAYLKHHGLSTEGALVWSLCTPQSAPSTRSHILTPAPPAPYRPPSAAAVSAALDILIAAGVATRSLADRRVSWNPHFGASSQSALALTQCTSMRASIDVKRRTLKVLAAQAATLERLVLRNAQPAPCVLNTSLEQQVAFPFMVIAMDHASASFIARANDAGRTSVTITLGAPFRILDDHAVLVSVDAAAGAKSMEVAALATNRAVRDAVVDPCLAQ